MGFFYVNNPNLITKLILVSNLMKKKNKTKLGKYNFLQSVFFFVVVKRGLFE